MDYGDRDPYLDLSQLYESSYYLLREHESFCYYRTMKTFGVYGHPISGDATLFAYECY